MVFARLVAAIALACASLFILSSAADARPSHRHQHRQPHVQLAHPDCNIVFPCEGVVNSPRGEMIARKVGIGAPQKIYKPRASASPRARVALVSETRLQPHPSGCPSRAFCGCGAAVRVFGSPVRSLWLAANWFKFPRAAPGAGMVAVRRHHVFVLEAHLDGGTWLAYDANSGGHATRLHARSISGYTIVNPHAGLALAWRA
jgi:hypothetical protein